MASSKIPGSPVIPLEIPKYTLSAYFGIPSNNEDMNNLSIPGSYTLTGATNCPAGEGGNGLLWVLTVKPSSTSMPRVQIFFSEYGKIYVRRRYYSSSQAHWIWSEWTTVLS